MKREQLQYRERIEAVRLSALGIDNLSTPEDIADRIIRLCDALIEMAGSGEVPSDGRGSSASDGFPSAATVLPPASPPAGGPAR